MRRKGDGAMGFRERMYETQLAKSAWLLELADHWSERDPEFAEQLRVRARQLQSEEEERLPLRG